MMIAGYLIWLDVRHLRRRGARPAIDLTRYHP